MGEDGKKFMKRRIVVALSGVQAVELLTGRAVDPGSLDTQPQVPGSG
jgi:hypothetical protein